MPSYHPSPLRPLRLLVLLILVAALLVGTLWIAGRTTWDRPSDAATVEGPAEVLAAR